MTEPRKFVPPSPELVAELRAEADRVLTSEEAAAYASRLLSDEERAQMDELIDWFVRRYPTPAERLAYARKWTLRLRATIPRGSP